jgi:hypothetical protein
MVVDSFPDPVVKRSIKQRCKGFLKSFVTSPEKVYSAVIRVWFIGYKLNIVIFDNGVILQSIDSKAM